MSIAINSAQAHRDSYLKPSAFKYQSHNRMDATFVDCGPGVILSGTPRLMLVALPDGFVFTKMKFFSGATVLASATVQVAYLLDASRTVLAASADRTNTSWAANTGKEFTFTSTSLRRPPGVYYAALVVTATTPPSLIGTGGNGVINTEAPISAGNSSTTGLVAPSTVGTVFGAMTGSSFSPYVLIG